MLPLIVLVICGLVLYALSQGAPYVPTKRGEALRAMELMNLPKGATIVDTGAGDGAVLKVAAERGHKAVGIELSRLLCFIARRRVRGFGGQVRVVRGNIFKWHLPEETDGVFLFTAGPFAKKMGAWLRREQQRLNKPLTVVSLGFPLPGETAAERSGACIKYVLE